jgi:hypothetical protein
MFIQTFGAWDFELNVEVESAEDIIRVRQELYEFCGADILSAKVLPKFKDLKFITHPSSINETSSLASSKPRAVAYE